MMLPSGMYMAPSDQTGFHEGIENFAFYVRRFTQQLLGSNSQSGTSMPGVSIHFEPDGQTISVFDGSTPQQGGTINYQESHRTANVDRAEHNGDQAGDAGRPEGRPKHNVAADAHHEHRRRKHGPSHVAADQPDVSGNRSN